MKKWLLWVLVVVLVVPQFGWSKDKKAEKEEGLDAAIFSGLRFRSIGPALMSGRVSDIAVHPEDESIWYVAVGSGGVWKTVNAGTTWNPVFDSQPSYSIGCVTIDPNHPDVIWIGTGENVSGRHVGFGDGIYKSLNGGKTWENMGLKKSEHISKILVDPRNSNHVYAAAEGPLWSAGGERGLFKSTDGGRSWTLVLEISQDTGVTDVVFHDEEPDILYAAAYQRRRSVAAFMGGGPESGIYKSSDAGETWKKLKVGLPRGHMGKIGLAVSFQDPDVVYATIEAKPEERGFYRSADRGESWVKRNSYISGGTGPHYYQEISADPHRFDCVYQMDVWMRVTEDGGKTFNRVGETYKHSDNHALAFFKSDPNYLLSGSDGGLYETWDRGKTWKYVANLPVTQFYKMTLDYAEPFYNIHGGTQDNSSQLGPSRTMNINGIRNSDWIITSGADGHACAIDPQDPNIIYCETQVGGLSRYDKKSGELVYIKPQPGEGEDPFRWNWDSPLFISPHSHTRIYFASHRLHRSDDRGNSWETISPDLTRNIFRYEQPIMGKTWSIDDLWDHGAMSMYSTITSISESPLKEGLIYAGTDDGLIQVTEDGGKNWRKIDKIPGVPDYFYVNEIRASRHDENTVYAAVDNHKTGDLEPYLLKSEDRGKTWTSIIGDLPKPNIVWAITQDHIQEDLLFIGAEFGIYFTPDGGNQWIKLSGGVPTISFRDIEIQERENDLVGASFGRGFYVLDDYSPLRQATKEMQEQEAWFFPVKKALMYIQSRPLSLRGKAFLGDALYLAPNPPFGAVFTYYLKDSVSTELKQRHKQEQKADKEGDPVRFPGWERLRQEDREDKPAVLLTIKDEDGQVVRKLRGKTAKGIYRIAWNLRYPDLSPTRLDSERMAPWEWTRSGPLVVPGTFTVTLSKRINGIETPLSEPQTFTVESLRLASLPEDDRAALLDFQKKVGELQRAMMGAGAAASEALEHLQFIKRALLDTMEAEPKMMETAVSLENRLKDIQMRLYGDWIKRRKDEPTAPALMWRLGAQLSSTSPITETNKQNYEIASASVESLLEDLRQVIEKDLRALKDQLEEAGAPWTPGRGIPKWKKK